MTGRRGHRLVAVALVAVVIGAGAARVRDGEITLAGRDAAARPAPARVVVPAASPAAASPSETTTTSPPLPPVPDPTAAEPPTTVPEPAAPAPPAAVTTTTTTTLTPAAPPAPAAAPTGAGGDPEPVETPPAWTATATPKGSVPGYDRPDGTPIATVTDTYYDIPTALPVIASAPGWWQVRLAPRPNGSTAWVRADDVTMGSTPWRIIVHLSTTRLYAYNSGRLVLDAPAGIGTDRTPTPTGEFFVTFRAPPPSPGYGPFVLATSGHSNVLKSFEGFPDAIIALHGPVGADAAIGATGAKVSSGCIRLHIADQQQLAGVPPGSPFEIRP